MYNRELKKNVGELLESSYKINVSTTEKLLDMFFSKEFLPRWYFYSNSPETIARHMFLYTQLLNANCRYLEDVNGKTITYFVNVGRDTPGRLERLLEENLDMDIGSFDAEYTKSGVSIISITKRGRSDFRVPEELWSDIKNILRSASRHCEEKGYRHGISFLNSVQLDYLSEEVTSENPGKRLYRHLEYYEKAMERENPVISLDLVENKGSRSENRLAVAFKNPDKYCVTDILKIVEDFNISLIRGYYDLFEGTDNIGILSIYLDPSIDLSLLNKKITSLDLKFEAKESSSSEFKDSIDRIIRVLTTLDYTSEEYKESLNSLISLTSSNSDLSNDNEYNNYYLNSVTDFLKGCKYLGILDNYEVLSLLLGYEALDEFFVSCRKGNNLTNRPGFRAKHNSARGPNKGGLRIDSIVRYDEVAALSFMMTWKCARSKILFGGGKGGLKLNPQEFRDSNMDFFDTLSNFGRSIFSVTGATMDVPAGDVGCGAKEIGHLFEGFKSALRDLSLLVYGLKEGVAHIGNKMIAVEEAREILYRNFDIDYLDSPVLKQLCTSEEYLNLVTAAQITGKPKMGIDARTGATGRGLCYSILQTISNLYLIGEWESTENLTDSEISILKSVGAIDEKSFILSDPDPVISKDDWNILETNIYPKLLRNKSIVLQGAGKVGSSVISELDKYGVKLIGIADVGGAISGGDLNISDLITHIKESNSSVIRYNSGVKKVIKGAAEGSEIMTLPCDILIPAALENSITMSNVRDIKCKIVACGSNGPCSSKAQYVLNSRGITVIYDFLANGAGVTASYFEWLRNMSDRKRYEDEVIRSRSFNIDSLDGFIMPEFRGRIKKILKEDESSLITEEWNHILRDIIIAQINEDFETSRNNSITMKTAGFANSILRVLAAELIKMEKSRRTNIWDSLTRDTRSKLKPVFEHPEVELFSDNIEDIKKELFT